MKLSDLKQKIEELDANATGGPWNATIFEGDLEWQVSIDAGIPDRPFIKHSVARGEYNVSDADFIALSRTVLPELLRRLLVAEEALDRIKRPVWWMQEDQRRKTGSINGVSGAQAVALSNDPNYLREIATAALATIRGEEE